MVETNPQIEPNKDLKSCFLKVAHEFCLGILFFFFYKCQWPSPNFNN